MAVLKLCQNKKEQTFVCWDAPFMNPFIAAGSWLKFEKKKIQKMVHNNKRSAITNRKYVFVILRKSMKNQLILAANKKNLTKILQKLFKSPTIMIPNQPLKNSSISRMDFMDLNQTSKLMRVK